MNRWMPIAFKYTGVKEIKGPHHAPAITRWLAQLKAWWRDDETPWCGVYVAAVMQEAGYVVPHYYMRAKAWLDWGKQISRPVYGCIVVFNRSGGGHVGFVVGYDSDGNLMVQGGNQGNAVNIRSFPIDRVLGYRVPHSFTPSSSDTLLTHAGKPAISDSEA